MWEPSVTRRTLLAGTVSGLAIRPRHGHADETSAAMPGAPETGQSEQVSVVLQVNGTPLPMTIELRTSLLDALRERAGLTGTKKGCDRGACGARTVHIDGRRVVSCLTLPFGARARRSPRSKGSSRMAPNCIPCRPHSCITTASSAAIARQARSCRPPH